MQAFAYIKPDYYILTAVAVEHIEYFKTLDAIAAEELAPLAYAKKVLINTDDVDHKYLASKVFDSYGSTGGADNSFELIDHTSLHLHLKPNTNFTVKSPLIGAQGAKAVLAAAAAAHAIGWAASDIADNISSITPIPGRLQLLEGKNNSIIIDDTYNASPVAVKAALDVLYAIDAKYRIAVLGSMNELGDASQAAHEEVGAYCNPAKLSLVVTVGDEAKRYLAPAAEKAGCTVMSFLSPYEAGAYLLDYVTSNTVVLAKGSQNGVFSEEVIKPLLADPTDAMKLVRQSPYWLKVKEQQFPNQSIAPAEAQQ
jgi:UDP-N-acetylmuramyl pentapeptide synthase